MERDTASTCVKTGNSRKRGPNEAPLPHPQVNGGLGLGYMATSSVYLILVIQKPKSSCEKLDFLGTSPRKCHDVLS
jgi:hypothetical protein